MFPKSIYFHIPLFFGLCHWKFSFLCHHCNAGILWAYATFANCIVWVLTCSLQAPWRWAWYRGSNCCQTAQAPLTCPVVGYQHHMGLSGHELFQRISQSMQEPFQLLQPWSHPAISPSASLRRGTRSLHFQAHWSPSGGLGLVHVLQLHGVLGKALSGFNWRACQPLQNKRSFMVAFHRRCG